MAIFLSPLLFQRQQWFRPRDTFIFSPLITVNDKSFSFSYFQTCWRNPVSPSSSPQRGTTTSSTNFSHLLSPNSSVNFDSFFSLLQFLYYCKFPLIFHVENDSLLSLPHCCSFLYLQRKFSLYPTPVSMDSSTRVPLPSMVWTMRLRWNSPM